jgi:hypothetical protein
MAAIALWPGISLGVVVISDSTFNDSDWAHSEISDTGNNGALTVSQQLAGGNPGSYQQGIHVWGPGFVSYGHSLSTITYDPSVQGAISTIDFSYDFITEAVTNPSTGGVATSFLIAQGASTWAYGSITVTAGTSWQTNSAIGLDASLFAGIDFSAAGSPITFGYLTSNSTNVIDGRTSTWGIDNWSVTINQVPLPAALWLFGSGLLGLASIAKRQKST